MTVVRAFEAPRKRDIRLPGASALMPRRGSRASFGAAIVPA